MGCPLLLVSKWLQAIDKGLLAPSHVSSSSASDSHCLAVDALCCSHAAVTFFTLFGEASCVCLHFCQAVQWAGVQLMMHSHQSDEFQQSERSLSKSV